MTTKYLYTISRHAVLRYETVYFERKTAHFVSRNGPFCEPK